MTHADGSAGEGERLLPVEEALRIVGSEAAPLGTEEVALEAALGRVLAETVSSPADLPGLDRSAMDGYALRSADLSSTPRELRVVGFIPAGEPASGIELRAGQAVRIMTGAPIPAGSDAVQMVERTEDLGGGARVRILAPVRAGENISRRGEDLKAGAVVLGGGTWIRAAEIGALAAIGKTSLRVVRLPVASLLSTGDEIVDPSTAPLPHQIRNSNGPALLAAMTACGIHPTPLGIARDEPGRLDEKIEAGLSGDLLILIGGVSVGDRDLVSERLRAAGVRVLFHQIAMKPGKPLLFGRRSGCLVFGLPGNPLSALTAFLVFALPAMRKLSGLPPTGLPEVSARLTQGIEQKPGRTWYRLARITLEDGLFHAAPVPSTGSGDLVSATRANGFVIVPADVTELAAGQVVRALLWPHFEIT